MRRCWALLATALVATACGGGGDDDGDAAAFCERLDRLARNDPFLAFGDRATPQEIETAFDALVERADELVGVAPPEARPAARGYAAAAEALDGILADAGYDGADADARAYADQQQAYAEAAARLERYLRTEC